MISFHRYRKVSHGVKCTRFEHSCLFDDFLSYKKNLEGRKIDDSTTTQYVKYKIFFVKVFFFSFFGVWKIYNKFNISEKDNYGTMEDAK